MEPLNADLIRWFHYFCIKRSVPIDGTTHSFTEVDLEELECKDRDCMNYNMTEYGENLSAIFQSMTLEQSQNELERIFKTTFEANLNIYHSYESSADNWLRIRIEGKTSYAHITELLESLPICYYDGNVDVIENSIFVTDDIKIDYSDDFKSADPLKPKLIEIASETTASEPTASETTASETTASELLAVTATTLSDKPVPAE